MIQNLFEMGSFPAPEGYVQDLVTLIGPTLMTTIFYFVKIVEKKKRTIKYFHRIGMFSDHICMLLIDVFWHIN